LKNTKPSKDITEMDYWQDNSHFADFYNTVFFHGQDILKPDKLYEKNSVVSTVIPEAPNIFNNLKRIRDVIKGYSDDGTYVLLAIENQSSINNIMPLRVRIYNDLNYLKQLQENNISFESCSTDSVSSHATTSRLKAVFTVVIYYGEADWTGPVKLSDMVDIPDDMKDFFDDSEILLVSAKDLYDLPFKNRDNRHLFRLIHSFHINKNIHIDITDLLKPFETENISKETLFTAGAIIGSDKLINFALHYDKEEITMYEAVKRWEQQIEERYQSGIELGRNNERDDNIKKTVLLLQKVGTPDEQIVTLVSDEFNLTSEQMATYL